MTAKNLSLASKIFAVAYAVGMHIGYLAVSKKLPTGDEMFGIIQISALIASLFAPVDISMIIRNLRGGEKTT